MKVLVATAQTQGQRHNDCCSTVEGELVFFFPPCRVGEMGPDACRCARVFTGLVTLEISTTAQVAELPDVGRAEYVEAMRAGFQAQGFPVEFATELGNGLTELISQWPIGTVVERRGAIGPRTLPSAGSAIPPAIPSVEPAGLSAIPSAEPAGLPAGLSAIPPALPVTGPALPPAVLFQPQEGTRPAGSAAQGQEGNVSFPLEQLCVPLPALSEIADMVVAKSPDDESRLYVDALVDGRDVIIREHYARTSLSPRLHEEWRSNDVARLRYLKSLRLWQLFSNAGKGKWWTYPYQERSPDIGVLLEEIRTDQHRMFWR